MIFRFVFVFGNGDCFFGLIRIDSFFKHSKGVKKFSYLNPRTNERITETSPEFLKPGELGYTASMRNVMLQAQAEKLPQVMVIDDDAIFACSFGADLKKTLLQPRCAPPVGDPRYTAGGFPVEGAHTLQLGAAVWMNGTYPNLGPCENPP